MDGVFEGDRILEDDTLETPKNHELNSLASLGLCMIFVFVVSSPATWLSWFPKHEGAYTIYKKQGEYGEFEKRVYLNRFPFQKTSKLNYKFGVQFFWIDSSYYWLQRYIRSYCWYRNERY